MSGPATAADLRTVPTPTDEEAAAIVAAVQVLLSGPAGDGDVRPQVSRWRFSGRWWSRPVPVRRGRPD